MLRRSMSMSQWVRAGLTFFCSGVGPFTSSAVVPSRRHSHVPGSSASWANGMLNVCPFGHAYSALWRAATSTP
jgi:hypothetical protein